MVLKEPEWSSMVLNDAQWLSMVLTCVDPEGFLVDLNVPNWSGIAGNGLNCLDWC